MDASSVERAGPCRRACWRRGHGVASVAGALCALAASLLMGAVPRVLAQSESNAEWTVLTVAHNGAWGLSTARSQGEAIARALDQCQSRAADSSDCGAELVAYKLGWSLAILCGEHRVLAAGADL